MRTVDHKLINDRVNNAYVMYDLLKDPWEMKNVAGDPAYAGTLAQLKNYMDKNEATYHYAPSVIQRFESWQKSSAPRGEIGGRRIRLRAQTRPFGCPFIWPPLPSRWPLRAPGAQSSSGVWRVS